MSDDNLEERLSSLEREVKIEAGLRALVDRDLSRLEEQQRHTTSLVQSLQDTQVEHGKILNKQTQLLTRLEETVAGHDERFSAIDRKLVGVDRRFDHVESRLDLHDIKLMTLDVKVDRLDAKMVGMDAKVTRLDAKVERILTLLAPPSEGAVETS